MPVARPVVDRSDPDAVAGWLDALFGGQQGYVYAPVGVGGFFRDNGKYNHERWEGGHFFRWPAQRAKVIAHVCERSASDDVYVAPRLRTGRTASMGSALDGCWLFADLDKEPTREQRRCLRKLRARRHMLVQSGSAGHQHVYLQLDERHPVEQPTGLTRRLALALGADSKWQDNTVLRPPGTLNHKAAASGATSTTVDLLPPTRDRPWTAAELDELLPPLHANSAALANAVSDEDWDGTLPRSFNEQMSEGAERGDRSERTFHFVMTLVEAGVPLEEIIEFAHGHQPTADRGRVDRDVQTIWAKHPHSGSSCAEVGCANQNSGGGRPSGVERCVLSLLRALPRQKWSGRDASRRKVVMAACQLALGFGDCEFYASQKDFALMAGVNRKTFVKRMKELSGWVECLGVGDRRKASVFRLVTRDDGPHHPQPIVVVECGPSSAPTWGAMADAFRYGGLGDTASRIYNEGLSSGPRSARDLQANLHLARSTINKGIARLAKHGLVEQAPATSFTRVLKSPDEWQRIAAAVGKLGKGERQEKANLADKQALRADRARYENKELKFAREKQAQFEKAGLPGWAKYWSLYASTFDNHAGAAVDTVVQVVTATPAGRIARKAQVTHENRLRAGHIER